MFDLLTDSANAPFAISLAVVVVLAMVELAGAAFGAGLSELLDGLLPDIDLDVDMPDAPDGGIVSTLLAWLKIGRVPAIVSLIAFLTAFGLCGLMVQQAVSAVGGFYLPATIAWLPAVFAALPVMSGFSGLLGRIMPKDETSAVSRDSFIGRVAVITLGTARRRAPAQAKLADEHRLTHYVMVEPDVAGEEFGQGDEVLLVRRRRGKFYAIRNTSAVLSNADAGRPAAG